MPNTIRDGTGSGKLVRVDSQNRLSTFAVTETEEFHAIENGDAYNINTGLVTLTDAADTPLVYIKNNEKKDLVVTAVAIGLDTSTGGSGAVYATFVRNPTTGTIITSTPTDVPINSNRNYGSAKTLTADAYVGATGDTMTDGDDHALVYLGSGGSRSFFTIGEVFPTGSSFGVKIDPGTGNTSQDVYVAVICYLADEE